MRLVVLESPYAGEVMRNVFYGRKALRDCLERGESPIASHLLLTQPGVLNDQVQEERERGIAAGHAWLAAADAMVVYADHGISPGMMRGIALAEQLRVVVEYRYLFKQATPAG